jgi:hypothetical protein
MGFVFKREITSPSLWQWEFHGQSMASVGAVRREGCGRDVLIEVAYEWEDISLEESFPYFSPRQF